MKRIPIFYAMIITILAGVAAYYSGDTFLSTGNHFYFWLHAALAAVLAVFIPPMFFDKDKYDLGTISFIEIFIGMIWGYINIALNGTMITTISAMGKNELLLFDAAVLMLCPMAAVVLCYQPDDE